jgi:hypothetical protein
LAIVNSIANRQSIGNQQSSIRQSAISQLSLTSRNWQSPIANRQWLLASEAVD